MSLGVLLSRDWGKRPADELMREVDASLYAAKAAGRNCIKLAKPEEMADIGTICISANDGSILSVDLHPKSVD